MKGASSARGITLDVQKLRGLRRQRSMTQALLATAADVSDDTVSRAERGRSISLENALAIAGALNVNVALLGTEHDDSGSAGSDDRQSFAASNVPIRVPVHFMGREEALVDIETAMGRYNGRVAITALHGLRGVGKTVVAAAYAERHRRDYRVTWWLRAETEPGMRADLVGLGVRLGWVGADDKEEPALAAVKERLDHEGDGILLIFDNAVDADSLTPYLPRGDAARVLITSNYHAWRGTAEPVEIRLWPKAIGADYLIARTGREGERKVAEDLSEALGGLPLAHEQAAAYCERIDLSLAEYARRFAAEPARLLNTDKDAPTEYHDKLTVAKTFALAIDAAARLHPAAEPLIVHAALLAPEPIPLFLFAEGREKFGEPLSSLLVGDGLDEAIAALRAFALIARETVVDERDPAIKTDTIRLHRLVREVVAVRREGEVRETARGALVAALAAVYPAIVYDDYQTWPRARRLNGLALDLVDGSAPLPPGTELAAADLMSCLAVAPAPASAVRSAKARSFLERAVALRVKIHGFGHTLIAKSLSNLAMELLTTRQHEDVDRAKAYLQFSLEITERAFGIYHPRTASILDHLAMVLSYQGEFTKALPLFERALEIFEKNPGPEDPETAKTLHNLAVLFMRQDQFDKAQPLFERSAAIYGKALHPLAESSLHSLAELFLFRGEFDAAERLYEQSLAVSEKTLGPEDPQTARNLVMVGLMLTRQGEVDRARSYYERALTIQQAVLGPEHLDLSNTSNHLGGLFCMQGDYDAARLHYGRALSIREKVFGPEHPKTVMIRENLSDLEKQAKTRVGEKPRYVLSFER